MKPCKIISFIDASYCNLAEEGSQGGFIIFLCNTDGKAAPIQRQLRKILHVVKSTLAAECLAQVEAAEACFLIKSQLAELLQASKEEIITECITDNQSLQNVCYSTKIIEVRRLRGGIVILREMLPKNEINGLLLHYCLTILGECLAQVEAAEACFLIKSQLAKLLQASKEEIITECITDSQSLQDICCSAKNIEDRRLRVDIVISREMLAKNEVNKIEWVETSSQLLDCLTKSGASTALLLDALRSGSLQFYVSINFNWATGYIPWATTED